jgi:hypothetical protein
MRRATTAVWIALLLALGSRAVLAEPEGPSDHAKHSSRTITLDGNDVRPSQTRMEHSDVLMFVNYSTHPVRVTFTEPVDQKNHIRCSAIRGAERNAPSAAWALFSWENDKLTATVPPGQFASVCSLEHGSYAFTVAPVDAAAQGTSSKGLLPAKGQIVVN